MAKKKQSKDAPVSIGRFSKLNDSRMEQYQKLRRDHLIKSYGDILKDDKLSLESSGGLSRDIAEDKTHFRVLLSIIYNEGERKSYPLNITRELFNIPQNIDITKTSEYNKIIRYIKRWEEAKIIQKSKTKLQHNISYYLVNYNEIIKQIIAHIDYISKGYLLNQLKKLEYKDNEYIIAFVKLYYYHLSLESPHYRDYTFNLSILNLIRYLFERIDRDIREMANFNITSKDLVSDDTYVKGIEKYGVEEIVWREGRIFGACFSDDFDIKKIPKKIIEEVRNKKIQAFVNTIEQDPIYNLNADLGKDNHILKDKKLHNFLAFIMLLKVFYDRYDNTKDRSNLVIPDLLRYISIKLDRKKYYDELDSSSKTWVEGIKDLEKNIDKIHKYKFPY